MAPVLKTQCPKCGGRLKITPKDEPMKVRCPACQSSIRIPSLSDLQAKGQKADDEMLEAEDYLLSDEDEVEDEYGDYDEYDEAASSDDGYGEDEYVEGDYDQDDEYEEMRRKRRRQQSARKKKKKQPATEPLSSAPQMNRALIVGICLAFGAGFVGVIIWLTTGGGGGGVGVPVAEGTGDSTAPVTQGANGGGNSEQEKPEVVLEKALAFVRDRASVLDGVERSSWVKNPGGELSLNWVDVSPKEPPPPLDIDKRIELSAKNAGIRIGSNWSFLPHPAFGENQVRVNMKTWQADQLEGRRDAMNSAAESSLITSSGMTSDGTMIGQALKIRKSDRHLDQHWVTIHEYDNTILKVIPNAKKMTFLTNDYILLATDGLAEYEGENPAAAYTNSVRNRRLPREVWFRTLTTDEETARIPVRPGGQWMLAPEKDYLIVVHPDEASAEGLKDPMGPLFDGLPSKTEIAIYKTENAEKVGEAVYSGLTVGYTARYSSDGKKLALHAGPNLAIIDLTNGKVLAKGSDLALEESSYRAPIWVAGDRFLLLDWVHLFDLQSGIFFGGFARPQDKLKREHIAINDWLGGEYFRYGNLQAYQPLPVNELLESADAVENPEANLLATRKVRLEIDVEKLDSLEQATLREGIKEALRIRCDLEVTDEENDLLPIVQVAFSERQVEGPFSMERWHQDATRQKVETDRNTWVKNVNVVEVTLDFKVVTPDGRQLAEFKNKGLGVPGGMNFEIPGQLQFRNAAVLKATETLELTLPDLVPVDPNGLTIPHKWKIDDVLAEKPDYAALNIQKIEVDNSWIDQELGLPIRQFALLIKDLKTIADRGIGRANFVEIDGQPSIVMPSRQGWFQVAVKKDATASPVQMPMMRRWAISPHPGGEFAGFNEGNLVIGSFSDPANAHQLKLEFTNRLCFSGDGSRLAMCLGQKGGFVVYSVADLKKVSDISEATPLATFDEPDAQRDMAFSGNGNVLVTCDGGKIVAFDVETGRGFFEHRVKSTPLKPKGVKSIAVNQDGSRLFAAIGEEVIEFSLKTLTEVRKFSEPLSYQVRLSPRGNRLAVARSNFAVGVIDLEGDPDPEVYKLGHESGGGVNFPMNIDWSIDGTFLLGIGHNGMSVWQIEKDSP